MDILHGLQQFIFFCDRKFCSHADKWMAAPKGGKIDKKPGRKRTAGRPSGPSSPVETAKSLLAKWRRKNQELVLLLATRSGEAYDHGQLQMALKVLLELMDEAQCLSWEGDSETGGIKGLRPIYCRASHLTGVCVPVLKERYAWFVKKGEVLVSDNSIRGRGSPNCDRAALRKLTPEHDEAVRAFIYFRNSSSGSGKVHVTKV